MTNYKKDKTFEERLDESNEIIKKLSKSYSINYRKIS